MTDTDKIIAYIDPDLEEIIPMFFENSHEELQELEKALADGDYENICRLGHSAKGSALNYGFLEMGRIGKAIEDGAKAKEDLDTLISFYKELANYVNNVEVVFK